MTAPAATSDSAITARLNRWRPWIIASLAVASVIWGLTDVRWRAKIDPRNRFSHRTDFTCFTEASAAFFDGRDPYEVTNIRGWGYPYPPLLALLVAPLVPLDTQVQCLVWYALCVLLCYGCYTESRRLVRCFAANDLPTARFPSWIGWLAAATIALPVLNCLQRGQVGIIKIYFLMLGLRLIVERRSWWRSIAGGVFLALPVAIKLTPILPVSIFLFAAWVGMLARRGTQRDFPRTVGATAGVGFGLALFFLFVPAALIGWNANLKHLDNWYHQIVLRVNDLGDADRTGNTRTVRNQSLSNAAYRLGNWLEFEFAGGPDDQLADEFPRTGGPLPMDAPRVEHVLLFVRLGLTLLLLIAAAATAWRGDALGQAAVFGMACTATLIVSPIGRAHYFMLELPALLFVPWWLGRAGKPRAAAVAAAVPLALCLAHYLAMEITGRLGLLGLGTTLWYLVALVPLVRGASPGNRALKEDSKPTLAPAPRRAA